MAKLWAGRQSGENDARAFELNASIAFDQRMVRQDIEGSLAHAAMLGAQGIIPPAHARAIDQELRAMAAQLEDGTLSIDPTAEDIHTFIEQVLTQRIGDAGKMLHTGRSRNDQVALDLRLYLADEMQALHREVGQVGLSLCKVAGQHTGSVMPGYTHLQRAQPVTLAHHLMAYVQMLLRDMERLAQARERTLISPLGAGALAATTYPLSPGQVAGALGMRGVAANSMDAVSDRDFVLELCAHLAILATHLSRLAEELIMWSSWEFRFVTLSDAFTTGSSIMPQKKNPDMAELIRGKAGRVYGSLITLLTTLKGLPLAYNKDMQEDKEAVFDAVDTMHLCLSVLPPMLEEARFDPRRMREAAAQGFINATDCADYLVAKGLPFRDAYRVTGELVARCIEEGTTLEALPMSAYTEASGLFEPDIFEAIDLMTCLGRRCLPCGPAPQAVADQIENALAALAGALPERIGTL